MTNYKAFIKNKNTLIPIIGLVLVFIFSLLPKIQISLLYLNGGFSYLIAFPFNTDKTEITEIVNTIVNYSLLILGYIFYYRTDTRFILILSCFLVLFSGQMIILSLIENYIKKLVDFYYFQFLLAGLTPILICFFIGVFKIKMIKKARV